MAPSDHGPTPKTQNIELKLPQPSSSASGSNSNANPDASAVTAQLPRTLSWLGAIGLAFSISNSWIAYTATFGTVLLYGGGLTVLFGIIIAAFAQWVVLLGVCEMVSALPSSGGCYHYTYTFAPKSSRKFASFVVGIINLLGFWIGGVAAAIYTTLSIFGTVSFWTGFVPGRWMVYLAYVGVVGVSLIPIFTIPASKTKHLTTFSLFLSLTLLVIFISVLSALTVSRTNFNTDNLTAHSNASGYPDSIAWLLSITTGLFCFSATGTVVHLAEEIPRAGRGVPVAINTTLTLSLATTIPIIIVLLAGIQDMQAVQEAWVPSLEAFYQASGSRLVATVLQGLLGGLYFTVVSTQWVSVSRIAWTLARDNALPFSPYFTHISPSHGFPIRTTLLSASFFVLFGLIYIASSTAFNSFVNIATLLVNIAFVVPQGILLCGRRDLLPKDRAFRLGRVGYIVNGFSVCWVVVAGVLFCFPVRVPTSMGGMN